MAIQSFADAKVGEFFRTGHATKRLGWSGIANVALRKLDTLDYAHELNDLRSPPGNRLEALKGDRKGYYSIRINDQWRLVFRWGVAGPYEVDIVDYH
jgi:proteic killer suppression protein